MGPLVPKIQVRGPLWDREWGPSQADGSVPPPLTAAKKENVGLASAWQPV